MPVILEQTEELQVAQTEIRHLKNTIQALRDEMEAVGFAKDENVSAAISESNKQILQLRATAIALRDEMERLKFNYEDEIEQLTKNARDEAKQLRETIQIFRDNRDTRNAQKKKKRRVKS